MIVVKKPQVEFLLLLILWRKPIKILINVVTEHDAPAFMELITTYTPNGSVMDQVISGLKHAQKYVLNGVTSTLSNGPIEGLICKIKTLKKMVMDFLNGSIVSWNKKIPIHFLDEESAFTNTIWQRANVSVST